MPTIELLTDMATCTSCGCAMHLVPLHDDTYGWRDDAGHAVTETMPDGRHPWELVDELKADGSTRAMAAYSSLSAALDLLCNPYRHVHHVDARIYDGEVPWCCDEPMQLRPSGWSCRKGCGQ